VVFHNSCSDGDDRLVIEQPGMTSGLGRAAAVALTAAVFFGICVIVRQRGVRVVVLTCLFVASLVSTQLSMKVLSGPVYNYKFPGLVTVGHFSTVSLVAYAYWLVWAREPWRCSPTSLGSASRYLRNVVPICLCTPVSVIFNNEAMVFVGAGVVAVIGTLAPVATAVLSRACGRKLSLLSWLGVLVAFSGGVVISFGEVSQVEDAENGDKSLATKGLVFAFMAVFGRAVKIVLTDTLLSPTAYASQGQKDEPVSIMHLYVLQFPLSTLISGTYSVATESVSDAWDQLMPRIAGVIAFTCLNALALNLIGVQVLKEFGASAQQIIGKLNTICIAALSVAFLGEHLPSIVVLGSFFVLVGVAIFEWGSSHVAHDKAAADDDEASSCGDSEEESSSVATFSEWEVSKLAT